jgi:1-deoxy-D-xylulose-5-phosphate synthase
MGGLGSAVLEFMADHGYNAKVKRLGIEDRFFEHGSQDQLFSEAGFNVADIAATAEEMLSEKLQKLNKLSAG